MVLTALTLLVAAMYAWTRPSLYNPSGSIDPWLYTAFWSHFGQFYDAFHSTYYASRLPWIIPGYLANGVLDPRPASLVVHTVFFLAGGICFYVLCRRWLGVLPAAIGYLALIGCQMYFNAHRWDYQEGAVLTYMLAALAFCLPRTHSPRVRAVSLAFGGFFAAAMVTTRVIDIAYLVGIPILYAAVMTDLPDAVRTRQLARDVVAFAAGAVLLLLGLGLVAHAAGGEFFFFMPQIRVVLSTTGGFNQLPIESWLPGAPYVWVPPFVAVFGAVSLIVAPAGDRHVRRILVASIVWLTFDFGVFAAWQFLGDGWLLNIVYYFSSFLVPTILCFAAAAGLLLGPALTRRGSLAIFGACAVAVIGPMLWIYRTDAVDRIASDYGDAAYVSALGAMVVAALLASVAPWPRFRIAGAAAVAVAAFAIALSLDASEPTFTNGASDGRTGALYDVGQQLVQYLSRHGYSDRLPTFWYDANDGAGGIGAIQSLYFYAYTYADIRMPDITPDFRSRMSLFEPDQLVVLCTTTRCEDGVRALRRAGYDPRRRAEEVLRSDGVRVRVQLYDVNVVD
jgi:hypothetical protein